MYLGHNKLTKHFSPVFRIAENREMKTACIFHLKS